jgi:hypothetical protein
MPAVWTTAALVTGAVHLASGQPETALETAQALLDDVHRIGMSTLLPEALVLLARIRYAEGHSGEALKVLTEAQTYAQAHGNRFVLPSILALLAEMNYPDQLSSPRPSK